MKRFYFRRYFSRFLIAICIPVVIFASIFAFALYNNSSENYTESENVTTTEIFEEQNETPLVAIPEVIESIPSISLETEPTEVSEPVNETEGNTVDAEPTAAYSGHGSPNTWDEYVGRFRISSVGVNVACYASSSQSTVDASDSAAYYYGNNHYVIADHTNQGFNAIKSCSNGTKASITTDDGVKGYTCVGKIQGHNTGYGLTDANWNDINDMYEGCLVCYTCNENWQNVTIVFFEPDDGGSAGVGDFYDEDEYGYYDDEDSGSEVTMTSNGKQYIYDPDSEEWFLDEEAENCNHSWGPWEFFCTGMEERICEKCWMSDYRLTQKTTRIETENDDEDDVSESDDWEDDWYNDWDDSDTVDSTEYEDETTSETESEIIIEYEDNETIEFENEESSENE